MRAGRNDPCPCGSGKKYKKCCWEKDQEAESGHLLVPPPPDEEEFGSTSWGQSRRRPQESLWEKFRKADYATQLALFQESLDQGLVDELNVQDMLATLRTATIRHGQRERFLELTSALRRQAPEVFHSGRSTFVSWEIEAALVLGQHERLADLVDELGRMADENFEHFDLTADQIAYHSDLDILVRLMRAAWPVLRDSDDLVGWARNDYRKRGIDLEIRAALEADPQITGNEPALTERLHHYTEEIDLAAVVEEVDLLAGRRPVEETLADYEWQPLPEEESEDDEDWDDDRWEEDDEDDEDDEPNYPLVPPEAKQRLGKLVLAFQGELRRRDGISWARSLLGGTGIYEYLLERGLGDLQDSRKRQRVAHPLCPDRLTFDFWLRDYIDCLETFRWQAYAACELLPAWLRFLEAHGLLDARQHQRDFAELSPLRQRLASLADRDRTDPLLGQGLSAWDTPPPAPATAP
jgi:hypothetical protein